MRIIIVYFLSWCRIFFLLVFILLFILLNFFLLYSSSVIILSPGEIGLIFSYLFLDIRNFPALLLVCLAYFTLSFCLINLLNWRTCNIIGSFVNFFIAIGLILAFSASGSFCDLLSLTRCRSNIGWSCSILSPWICFRWGCKSSTRSRLSCYIVIILCLLFHWVKIIIIISLL